MPALQNVVLTDREATPVAHTFVPDDIKGGIATVVENPGVPVGANQLSISLRKTAGKLKTRERLVVPVVQTETINGISTPKVVREGVVDCTFTFDRSSTEQERKNVVGMFMSSLDPTKVLINDVLIKGQGVYGG